ncbi:hypothetical protein PIIN_05529 [Serendipita indica DSM 11827]|uniref:WLM domain-containing protein n=1 Tax=Serendipita indica (strain DSM 11827) TaxID=1109443 RepID=G4TJU3_SERID|nr:hypothetical protein PIIN_05529 [Serendipita indica DSM 11827]
MNPNPHINFITALNTEQNADVALKILRAVAAQLRPVMKKHGLEINSFEEVHRVNDAEILCLTDDLKYEHNSVFLGRNWNAGETLSHIKNMHHGPSFWKFYRELKAEVAVLQRAKYFGDGFWSSGKMLIDGVEQDRMRETDDFPEYLCGGAHTMPPPRRGQGRKRVARKQAGPSLHTGTQTTRKVKPGSRVRSHNAFKGDGKALNADEDEETRAKLGTGFRKQAGSKKARDIRAAAIEARLNQSKNITAPKGPQEPPSDSETEDEEDYVRIDETDADRRRLMDESVKMSDMSNLKSQSLLTDHWKKGPISSAMGVPLVDLSDEEGEDVIGKGDAVETVLRLGLLEMESGTEMNGGLTLETKTEGRSTEGSSREWACGVCTL